MSAPGTPPLVTCLGCGLACDDLAVREDGPRLAAPDIACAMGAAWVASAEVPWQVLVDGRPADAGAALDRAAALLGDARGRLLVAIGGDLTTDAIRAAVAVADVGGAVVETLTSAAAAEGLLAAQRRGRAAATLGEVRNRADVLVYWGCDPARTHPRFAGRIAPLPLGTQVPEGRAGRVLVAVAVGADSAPRDADLRLDLAPADEVAALGAMRAAADGRMIGGLAGPVAAAAALVERLAAARYVAIVHDAEASLEPARDPGRAEALIALAQALNGPTRAALVTLRGGGNRAGAEAVLTWQTGYPFAVDFAGGVPRYRPARRGRERLADGHVAAALVAGDWRALDAGLVAGLRGVRCVAIGPGASAAPFAPAVAIDTGRAGLHEDGTVYRMDDVPLPARAPLAAPRRAAELLGRLAQALAAAPAGRPA